MEDQIVKRLRRARHYNPVKEDVGSATCTLDLDFPFLGDLTEPQMNELIEAIFKDPISYSKGDVILKANTPDHYLYFINKGMIREDIVDKHGIVCKSKKRSNGWVCNLANLINPGNKNICTCTVIEPVKGMKIEYTLFTKFMDENPKFRESVHQLTFAPLVHMLHETDVFNPFYK